MDTPSLVRHFAGDKGMLASKIKELTKLDEEKEKNKYNIFMDLDPKQGVISLELAKYNTGDAQKYYYFGNNSAAGSQFYAVREATNFYSYWLGRTKGIFCNIMEQLDPAADLYFLLEECRKQGLFDENGPDSKKLVTETQKQLENFIVLKEGKEKGKIQWREKTYKCDKFLSTCLELPEKDLLVLVIPRIVTNEGKIVISTTEDYLKIVDPAKNSEEPKKRKGNGAICHICGKLSDDIDTVGYSTKLSRSSINKIFVTTTVNYAPYFAKENFQDNYALCKQCYEQLYQGEKTVMNDMRLKIAGETCIVLPEGLERDLDYDNMTAIKNRVDAIFNPKDIAQWKQDTDFYINIIQNIPLYQINLNFYETDGNSCAIKKTIESISELRLNEVTKVFLAVRQQLEELSPKKTFLPGNIYNLIAVQTNNKNKQLNVGRVFDLYADILNGYTVNKNYIFDLYSEALTKGLNQLNSQVLRNYKNLDGLFYAISHKDINGKDWFIKNLTVQYRGLFLVLQQLGILDKEVFTMSSSEIATEKVNEVEMEKFIEKIEAYLDKNGFDKSARGLFYLGILIYKIGVAQAKQGHKQKPILDKITYSGMTNHDVLILYTEVLEKIRQYRKIISLWYCDFCIKQLQTHLGNLEALKLFTEKENVYYIMAGYAYNIGRYKADKTDGNDGNDDNETERE